jgi:hypothetical protein
VSTPIFHFYEYCAYALLPFLQDCLTRKTIDYTRDNSASSYTPPVPSSYAHSNETRAIQKMPAPYSDNLYSADSDNEPDALSPTDGYFHASESSSSRSGLNVPHVPNVLVEDPTQLSRDAKVQEAERERRLLSSGSPAGDEPGSTASSHAGQESAGDFDNPIALTPRSPPRVSPLFAHPVDAPPAYSPSPTSPNTANNYQTFTSTATMGRPEEASPLIIHAPESMSNPSNPSQSSSRWQRFKDSVTGFNIRRKVKTILASLVIFSVVFMIFSSFTINSNHGVCTTHLLHQLIHYLLIRPI